MSSRARTGWPQPVARQAVKPRRADPPVEETWLYRINPQRALEMQQQRKKGRK